MVMLLEILAKFRRLRQCGLLVSMGLILAGWPGVVLAEAPAKTLLSRTAGGFPSRPVRILVPTSPGGLIDYTARKFAEVATQHTGLPFVVINKPGGGGVVAFEETLRAPADGYTLQAATRSNIAKLVGAGRSDLLQKMWWAAKLLDDPQCVIVNRESAITDWAAVVANAQALAGRQLWLGPDIGGLDHVSAAHIWKVAGIQARWIPYESGGQAIAALLGGMGATYTGNPSETRGRPALKIAAVCAAERLPEFPEAPTFAELGLVGLEQESMWRGFVLHPATPPEVRAWFEQLFAVVTEDAGWREEWEKDGIRVGFQREPEFRALVEKEVEQFTDFLQSNGLLPAKGREIPRAAPKVVVALIALSLVGYVGWAIGLARRERRAWRWSAEDWVILLGWALTVCFVWWAGRLPAGTAQDPFGAAGVPLLWCALLLPCLAVMGWQAVALARAPGADSPWATPPAYGLALGFAGLLIAGVGAMLWLGYYLATALTLPLLLGLLGWRRWLSAALLVVGWLAFVFFVFHRMLNVDLPTGGLF